MLAVRGLTTRYGSITALRDATIDVGDGELVGIVGPNGAGKSTLMNSVIGAVRPDEGRVELDGRDVTGLTPDRMLRLGVALVPERRRLFADLTVEENLLVAAVTVARADRRARIETQADLFPVLRKRWRFPAGYLSGGEAQQLAIARALVSEPRVLLMDEPTLGLAPAMVDVLFELVARLHADGRTVVVVEQNARQLLALADRAYLLRTGDVVFGGPAAELAEHPDLFDVYLGVGG
jgi:branched-chain amino acid transport system ATP-binding protein